MDRRRRTGFAVVSGRIRRGEGVSECPRAAEALYLACLLHDIALGGQQDAFAGCFAILGAERARRFVTLHGGNEGTGRSVHDSIARHMDVETPEEPEAVLLHDSAYLDLSCLEAVEAFHPRDGFVADFGSRMKVESARAGYRVVEVVRCRSDGSAPAVLATCTSRDVPGDTQPDRCADNP